MQQPPRMRVAAVGIVVFSLFAALFARLYYLQVLDAKSLEELFASSDELHGTIRLACVTAFAHRILAPLLAEFRERHPRVRFEVEVSDDAYIYLLYHDGKEGEITWLYPWDAADDPSRMPQLARPANERLNRRMSAPPAM